MESKNVTIPYKPPTESRADSLPKAMISSDFESVAPCWEAVIKLAYYLSCSLEGVFQSDSVCACVSRFRVILLCAYVWSYLLSDTCQVSNNYILVFTITPTWNYLHYALPWQTKNVPVIILRQSQVLELNLGQDKALACHTLCTVVQYVTNGVKRHIANDTALFHKMSSSHKWEIST